MAYCSTADVKTYLKITGAGDDALIATLIPAAQAAIDTYCDRTFEASEDTTRYYDAIGGHITARTIYLDEDLCAITTVTNGDSATVGTSEYTVIPKNDTPYYAVKLLQSSGKVWTYTTDNEDAISIEGKWAYSAAAPADVKQACIRLASFYYRQKDKQVFDVEAIEAGTVIKPQGLPSDVRVILKPYVRH